MAAAHLREEYALEAGELDVIGQTEADRLSLPGVHGPEAWAEMPVSGLNLQEAGEEDPVGKRWGDKVWDGDTLVVARANDPETAQAIARELHHTGAGRIDILPH